MQLNRTLLPQSRHNLTRIRVLQLSKKGPMAITSLLISTSMQSLGYDSLPAEDYM